MANLHYLYPTLFLSAGAFILFALDTMRNGEIAQRRNAGVWIALAALVSAALSLPCGIMGNSVVYGKGMLVADGLAVVLSMLAILTSMVVVGLSAYDRNFEDMTLSSYLGLLLLSAAGIVLVVSANDFLMIFLGIELVGIPAFIMTGYLRKNEKSGEAAMKFFLIGAFSSAMLAYGISILYGLTGTTSLTGLKAAEALLLAKSPLAVIAVFFIVVSFGFKIALVPFHMWVPDAFEGAPTPIAAYLSVAPKMAGVAIAIRVFSDSLPSSTLGAMNLFAILAALTMTIANIIGLQQKNVIRLLAYSSIAHMGYVILGLVAGSSAGISSIYLYGWVYLFMNLGAFAVVVCLSNSLRSSEIASYAGLGARAPVPSFLLALFLISLAGIPPTAGFIAKFYVFAAAYQAGWLWLVIVAAVNSVISVGYYFKILHAMYFKAPVTQEKIVLPMPGRVILALTSFATLCLGIVPQVGISRLERFVSRPVASTAAVEPGTPQP